jgi:hypothetical protein
MTRFLRTWTDDQLVKAVAEEHSWSAVARALGLRSTASWVLIHRRAEELGLDASHFRGKLVWSDEMLAQAVTESKTWSGVTRKLGAGRDKDSLAFIQELARQMCLKTLHLQTREARQAYSPEPLPDQTFANFGLEAEYLAAAWFVSRGFRVTLASSGLPYDLILDKGGELRRVQVKSAKRKPTTSGTVTVNVHRLTASAGAAANRRQLCYNLTDFDLFFILTGEGHVFLVPLKSIAGQKSLRVGPASPYYVQTIGLSGR